MNGQDPPTHSIDGETENNRKEGTKPVVKDENLLLSDFSPWLFGLGKECVAVENLPPLTVMLPIDLRLSYSSYSVIRNFFWLLPPSKTMPPPHSVVFPTPGHSPAQPAHPFKAHSSSMVKCSHMPTLCHGESFWPPHLYPQGSSSHLHVPLLMRLTTLHCDSPFP